ncbi:eukaryotic translation initiation factor 4B3-like isoform X2 [Canna indica]|uniref:Eukaryotic translation initiation factor 4B3-like isoform X2 n=1 Tax=Canna indica TaxID=4628 RepID=A0AAQ3JZ84_9LILI|nr:eukaryotic translation initiation factor 4B3-like isoform X2 [Canna indica]
MAASVSAWAKPGAWALDAEEHEAAIAMGKDDDNSSGGAPAEQQQDFPSLSAAASAKTSKKKKKAQPISLAEFTTGKPVTHGAASRVASSAYKGLISDELLVLPTGPRERSAEELERSSSRGFGYSFGARGRASGEDSNPSRWGSDRTYDEPRRGGFGGSSGGSSRDLEPPRADEIDDWGAAKKSFVPERRERGGGGFFDSQSKADESDSWISSKSTAPPADGRRVGGGAGFGGPRERMGGFDMFSKEGSNGGRADSDTWGKKKDFADSEPWKRGEEMNSGGRRRIVLQPRSLPSDGNNGEQVQDDKDNESTEKKRTGSNPFGQARPREEVLAEKGQDWKKIDEKLETLKIRDAGPERSSFDNKGFGMADRTSRSPDNPADRAWRKPNTADNSPTREEKAEDTLPEN